jgi:hypothetical protein
MSDTKYRGWIISHYPPPIGDRSHDWQFAHEDYDGPEDSRIGTASSLEGAMAEIDEMLEVRPGSTVIEATVKRYGSNTRFVSLRMIEAEPYVMRFCGDGGVAQYAEAATEMLTELSRLGHEYTVKTVYEEAGIEDMMYG